MTTPLETGEDQYTKARRMILGAPMASSNEAFRRDLAAAAEHAARMAQAEQRRRDADRACRGGLHGQ